MIANEMQNAAALQIGREVLALVEPWIKRFASEGASQEVRSRNVGHGLLIAVLLAAREDGLNRIWLINGLGQAIGEAMGLQDDVTQSLIVGDLQKGIALGLVRVEREMTPAGEA